MKKIYFSVFGAILCFAASAQTFSTTSGAAIYDNQCATVTMVASGLPTTTDTTVFGICSVAIEISHSYDGDLDIWLVNPSNDTIQLTNNNGGGGANFVSTVFTMSATQSVNQGNAPFTGSYWPFISLNNLNNGSDPNGTWKVIVCDEAPNDQGVISSASVTFCVNPPNDPPAAAGPCSIANGGGCFCPDGSQDCDLLPDMIATADIITQQHTETPGLITLSNATPNIGWGPMEIHGSNFCWCDTVSVPCSTVICPSGDPPTQQLNQTLYHKSGTTITSFDTLTPGTMSYHPTHGHVHVNNWAVFSLRKEDTTLTSPLDWPIVAQGAKVSFCLINLGDCTNDYGWCKDTLGNVITMADIPNAPFGVVSGCGVDQGIYTGNLDIYSEGLPGMNIDLTNVCNGNYYIVSITDPDNDFVETDETNNWVAVPISLTQQHNPIGNGINLTSISGNTITVSNNNTDLTSFTWDFGDGTIDTVNNPAMHTYVFGGNYTVTLTQTNACGTYDTTMTVFITGMEQMGNFSAQILKAMPNPAMGSTTISYQMPQTGNMQLELFNMLGERVSVLEKGNQATGWHTVEINFDAMGLGEGAYFVKLTTLNHEGTMRVINIK
ncbi:MAG: PKD domain-containing protein [Bacteroidota bacterium]|nr:PKD domain-containing protein [Bacteroidota bacterium]